MKGIVDYFLMNRGVTSAVSIYVNKGGNVDAKNARRETFGLKTAVFNCK